MDYTEINTDEILNWLKENLNEERYEHSIGTAQCAKDLAKKYGLNEEKAYIAGLLHDCAKCFPKDKMLEIIDEHVNVEQCERMNFKTLHAPVSFYIARTEFLVEDEEILSAIRWHTIGQLDMTDFEKAVFIADKIEPRTREKYYAQPIIDELSCDNGLNRAMLQCCKHTIKSLVDRNLPICPLTIDIYNKFHSLVNVK